jgi:hypothetical protein
MTLNMMLLLGCANSRGNCYVLDWALSDILVGSVESPEVTAISVLENYISQQ